jgi:phage shock protein A
MGQSVLSKIGILVSATLHGIVDRALEANSLGVFDDYIRQAESSMNLLETAIVDLKVTVKSMQRKYDQAANEAAKLDMQVDAALKANKETLAKATMLRMNNQLEIARTYKDQYEKQYGTYNTLIEVVQVLEAKVDVLKSQRDQVATLVALIKSKNMAARSIKDIEKISDERAAADARLEAASSRLSTQIETEVSDATLEAQLEERRAKLGL